VLLSLLVSPPLTLTPPLSSARFFHFTFQNICRALKSHTEIVLSPWPGLQVPWLLLSPPAFNGFLDLRIRKAVMVRAVWSPLPPSDHAILCRRAFVPPTSFLPTPRDVDLYSSRWDGPVRDPPRSESQFISLNISFFPPPPPYSDQVPYPHRVDTLIPLPYWVFSRSPFTPEENQRAGL